MNNAVYDRRIKNVRNEIDIKQQQQKSKQQKRLFKRYINTKLYITGKNWQQFSCNIKRKVSIKLSKLAYIGMCVFELIEILT